MKDKNILIRLNSSKLSIAAICQGIFLILLFCNFNTNLMADDFLYCFSFADGSPIDSVWDIFPSMAAHRHSMNGRVIAHFLAQLFLMLPKFVFNIFNAAFFLALIWLMYIIGKRDTGHNALLLACCFGLIWLLQPDFGQVFLWLDGSVNYLWCAVLCLLYLLPWIKHFLYGKELSPVNQIIFVLFSLIVGAYSENSSVAVIFMSMLFMLLCRCWDNKKLPLWMWLSLAAAFIGFFCMMLAPAESVNKSAEFTITVLFANFLETGRYYLKFWPLLTCFVLFYALLYKDKSLQRVRVLSLLFLLGSLAGHFVLTFAMYCSGRSTYIALVLLICAVVLLFVPAFEKGCKKLLIFLCVLCLCFTAYYGYVGIRDIQRTYYLLSFNEEIIREAIAAGEKNIQLPRPYAQTKYSALEGLGYLEIDDPDSWYNVTMARYYGVDSIIGY